MKAPVHMQGNQAPGETLLITIASSSEVSCAQLPPKSTRRLERREGNTLLPALLLTAYTIYSLGCIAAASLLPTSAPAFHTVSQPERVSPVNFSSSVSGGQTH